ncbi:hypothetical protein [Bartonella ancashensis]|uniref:Uncharacterized protein n=1 Tax=Bartonella ancashensis TaxID=1318743 RepID=A0A0M4L800_9HYPH|nr:hypothetical protein [Bartonella ancashensis]ALE03500.1 hypothetical protein PU02_0686 [Bartonella ancashensis]
MEANAETFEVKALHELRTDFYNHVLSIGQSGDLSLILEAEYNIVVEDLKRHANSPGMISSLETALIEINSIKKHMKIVVDPVKYQIINEAYEFSKNRKKGLPYDEARQTLASHYTRLNNLDKARLTIEEKSVIDARKRNMKIGRQLYEQMQAKILGVDLPHEKDVSL